MFGGDSAERPGDTPPSPARFVSAPEQVNDQRAADWQANFLAKVALNRTFRRMRRKAIISAVIGLTLGVLAGAIANLYRPATSDAKPYLLSVNEQTGRPQIHVRGKPELK